MKDRLYVETKNPATTWKIVSESEMAVKLEIVKGVVAGREGTQRVVSHEVFVKEWKELAE